MGTAPGHSVQRPDRLAWEGGELKPLPFIGIPRYITTKHILYITTYMHGTEGFKGALKYVQIRPRDATHRIIFEILLNLTETRLYLPIF